MKYNPRAIKWGTNDLNLYSPEDDVGNGYARNTKPIVAGDCTFYNYGLKAQLIKKIGSYPVVLGCVAWLTCPDILLALSDIECSIVVQKEDFLRPDGNQRGMAAYLRPMYSGLRFSFDRYCLPGVAGTLSVCGDPEVDAVRCVGNHNRDRKPAHPRMHHKFAVFCDLRRFEDGDGDPFQQIIPKAVWTGSFNWTKNAGKSLENAVFIDNQEVANWYAAEYAHILALSEPLDWEDDWCLPEWRIGT